MPYVPSFEILRQAQIGHYAVGAFNAENMEMAQAIVAAAERMRAPVLIQTSLSTARYTGYPVIQAIVRTLAEQASVPVALHLDHAESLDAIRQALAAGFSTVMIDCSKLAFEENIAVTQQAVALAHAVGIPVEGELGKVGGKEDDHESEGDAYTDPEEARDFVARTGVDSLAVGIGTAHGVYQTTPKLDVERLSAVRQQVDVPLVLHGASGLSDDAVRECIRRGICKVNFATELRQAFTGALRQAAADKPNEFDPKALLKPAREAVLELVAGRIAVCGCDGKA